MGTLGTWCGHPRITSEFLKYVLKGEGTSSGPMEKVRVHNFPWVEAKAAVDAAVAAVDDATPWLRLRFVVLGCLQLVWPARPHTVMSCLVAGSYLLDDWVFLLPHAHKRRPSDGVFRMRLPASWLAVFVRFFRSVGSQTFLFSTGPTQPGTALYD